MKLLGTIIMIIATAILAFVIADFLGVYIHWYMLILLICAGLFIQLIIFILQTGEVQDLEE